ncbi:sulfotransferase 1A1-like [Haliotis asinina]|uniref:sulfotransferase 1A1-like n=1 Tax=Haliotis asinina TaxID=109174 RepID=UPI0035324135
MATTTAITARHKQSCRAREHWNLETYPQAIDGNSSAHHHFVNLTSDLISGEEKVGVFESLLALGVDLLIGNDLMGATAHLVEVPDDGGDTCTLIKDNGVNLPNLPITRTIDDVRSVKIRDDDIMLCTYPRSGTHWVYEITRELLTGEITNDDVTMTQTYIEYAAEESYADLQSPRLLCSHLLMKHLPEDVLKKRIKVITVLRNPKDVAVSFYNFSKTIPGAKYGGKWENYLQPLFQGKFMYGSWIDHIIDWEQVKKTNPDLPVLTLFYEDIKQDQMREMRRICEFLGVGRTDDFLSRVYDNTTMKAMGSTKNKARKLGVFRKGGVGDWKNWFTVAQNEWFDQLYWEKMADCPLQFKYTL